jgi:hypothetical protein
MAWLTTLPTSSLTLTQISTLLQRYQAQFQVVNTNSVKNGHYPAYNAIVMQFKYQIQLSNACKTDTEGLTVMFDMQVFYNENADGVSKEGKREEEEKAWDKVLLWGKRHADVVGTGGGGDAQDVGTQSADAQVASIQHVDTEALDVQDEDTSVEETDNPATEEAERFVGGMEASVPQGYEEDEYGNVYWKGESR